MIQYYWCLHKYMWMSKERMDYKDHCDFKNWFSKETQNPLKIILNQVKDLFI